MQKVSITAAKWSKKISQLQLTFGAIGRSKECGGKDGVSARLAGTRSDD